MPNVGKQENGPKYVSLLLNAGKLVALQITVLKIIVESEFILLLSALLLICNVYTCRTM